ncbi:MAG: tRNA (adenosine(37)-N6)-threonylcarbamoyltransferase complex ATPase subunit type 1 TsaE [Pelagibacterales bacterium]|nr:tRNA (adenosine(37)-N6)-threonylcarbamoyltransferase complex ATPase subunit type 1 TsaE [Pelagibacterales bacterium]
MEIITKSAGETQKVGRFLAGEIKKEKRVEGKAVIIALEGDLGGGKTTFVQGFAKGLGIKDKITSPTFVIFKKYDFFYHIDCYRIKDKDLLELDFNEIINNYKNIVIIEWAEKIKKILPKNTLWMKFEYLDKNKRKIIIK